MSGAEGHGCWPLYVWNWEKISAICWEKQIKCETGLGLALPCTRAVFIVFILLLLYYLFMHLSIYFFIRLLAGLPRARREDSCFWLWSPWSRVGHALRPLFMLWLVKIWQLSSCGKFMQHLKSCLLWQSWSWQSFVSTYDVFNCLFPLDAQNEIQLLSGVFCYSWLVGFWLRN